MNNKLKKLPSANIIVNGKKVKKSKEIYIGMYDNFSIELSNETNKVFGAKVWLNNIPIRQNGSNYVLMPADKININEFNNGKQQIFTYSAEIIIEFYNYFKLQIINKKNKFGRILLQEFNNTEKSYFNTEPIHIEVYTIKFKHNCDKTNENKSIKKLPNSCQICKKRIRSKTWKYCPECGTKLI